jgi:hypothetical protein
MRKTFATLLTTLLIAVSDLCTAQTAEDFAERLRRAEDAFRLVRDYNASAQEFTALLDASDPLTRPKIIGYLNASLYTLGKHDQALQLICRESNRQPSSPDFWLFDIHAHARKVALNEGYARSVELMQRYRANCGLASFSSFWAAIPLVKMEFLRAGVHVLAESYILPEKDRIILDQLLQSYPNDPYSDYARYFLHRFAEVHRQELLALNKNPKPPAVPPRPSFAEDPYVMAQINKAPVSERQELRTVIENEECHTAPQCALVTKWLTNSVYPLKLLSTAIERTMTDGQLNRNNSNFAELEDLGRVYFAFVTKTNSSAAKEASAELRYFVDRLRSAPEEAKQTYFSIYASQTCPSPPPDRPSTTAENEKYLSTCLAFLNHFRESTRVPMIAYDELRSLTYTSPLTQLLAAYHLIASLPLPTETPSDYRRHLDRVVELTETNRDAELLSYAISLKGRLPTNHPLEHDRVKRFPYLAARIFEYLAAKHLGDPTGEKALWLWQSIQRRVSFTEREPLLREFIEKYPKSELIDDAFAELGLLFLDRGDEKDKEQGRSLLEKVYRDYPTKNAADNALYHLAADAMSDGRYLAAANYYSKMFSVVAGNRLRSIARNELPTLRGASEGLRGRKYVAGIALSRRGTIVLFDEAAVKADEPLQVGDQLVNVDGKGIEFEKGFYEALEKKSIGDRIKVVFQRRLEWNNVEQKNDTKEISARLQVVQSIVFDVAFVRYDDQLIVREKPDIRAEEIAKIPADGKCLRYAGADFSRGKGSQLWIKTKYISDDGKEFIGWVNASYLRRSTTCLN